MLIERTTDAAGINRILNDPGVRPWVADVAEGELDVSDRVSNPANVTLVGDYGAFFCFKYAEGIYEVHTAILPEGRGEWGLEFAKVGSQYMFTGTDCVEILTRVPQGHIAAKALTEAVGFRPQFTTPPECKFRGRMVPAHIYSLTLQEWFSRADQMESAGSQFHAWLNKQVEGGVPHENDPAHNRVVGVTLAMALSGMVRKAVVFYNRCAIVARHDTIALLNESPPQIKFDAGILTLAGEGIRFERSH